MERDGHSRTRQTLLARLCHPGDPDQAAWAEFVEHYGGKVYRWCLHWGLQEADAADVTQQVLLKLAGRMKSFTYDPAQSFRAWLKTVARHALIDFEAHRRHPGQGSGDRAVADWLLTLEARTDLEQRLEQEYDRELLEEAMRRVRLRVAPHTWEAFRLTALDGMAAAEVATRLHMKVATVYQARSSVVRLLQQERQTLEADESPTVVPPGHSEDEA